MAESVDDFMAGLIGGTSGLLISQPLDYAKVMNKNDPRQQSLARAMMHIARKEGMSGFFRGVMPPLLSVGLINAMLFGSYGLAARAIEAEKNHMPLSHVMFCGSVAGAACFPVISVTELLKIRAQTATTEEGRSTFLEAKRLIKRYGVRSLFKGWEATMWRDVSSFGAYFVIYEASVRALISPDERNSSNMSLSLFGKLLASGGVAGCLSWLIVYHFDVVKTRLQAQDFDKPQYKDMRDCFRQLYKAEGYKPFFRGLNACLYRAFPLNGVTLAMYEISMMIFHGMRHEKTPGGII